MNNILKLNNMITEEINKAFQEKYDWKEMIKDLPLEAYQISGTAPIDYKNTNGGNPQ